MFPPWFTVFITRSPFNYSKRTFRGEGAGFINNLYYHSSGRLCSLSSWNRKAHVRDSSRPRKHGCLHNSQPGLHRVLLGLIHMLTSQGKMALHRRWGGGVDPDAITWSQGIYVVTTDLEAPPSKSSLQVWLENSGGGAGASLLPQIPTGGTVSCPSAFSPATLGVAVVGNLQPVTSR